MILQIVLGILGIAIGLVLIAKTEWFIENFGRIEWAEQKLGTEGGTRLFYKIIGLVFIFFAFVYMTGLWDEFLNGTLGRIFGSKK
jgi:uncharacterized membrane protein